MENGLFESGAGVGRQWYALVNRTTLMQSFGASMLLPQSLLPEDADAVSKHCGDALLVVGRGVSAELCRAIESAMPGEFPVLCLLSSNVRVDPIEELGSEIGLVEAPIPIGMIVQAAFPSEELLRDFQSRSFDDVPSEVVPCGADPARFALDDFAPLEAIVTALEGRGTDRPALSVGKWESCDKVAGALLALVRSLPADQAWFRVAAGLIRREWAVAADLPDSLGVALPATLGNDGKSREKSGPEAILLKCGAEAFAQSNPKTGWVPSELLESICAAAMGHAPFSKREDQAQELKAWAQYCKELLDGEGVVRPLTDEKYLVRRAILLVLLHETPQGVVASRDSMFEPGPRVLAVAAMLAGIHVGFRRQSAESKQPPVLSRLLGELVCDLLRDRPDAAGGVDVEQDVIAMGVGHQRLRLLVGGESVVARDIEAHPALRQIAAIGERLGINLECDDSGRELRYTHKLKNGRPQSVRIRMLPTDYDGRSVVRFSSRCLALHSLMSGTTESEAIASLRKTRSKKVSRDELIGLLLRNDRTSMHCRFSISPEESSIVASVDQIVETLDDDEFRAHIEHVAQVADEFESGIGLG